MPGDPDARAHRDRGSFKLKGPAVAKPRLTPEALATLYAKQGIKPSLQSAARQAGRAPLSFKKSVLTWSAAEIKAAMDVLTGVTPTDSSDYLLGNALMKSLVEWVSSVEETTSPVQLPFCFEGSMAQLIKRDGRLTGCVIDPEAGIDADFEDISPERFVGEMLSCYGIGDAGDRPETLLKAAREERAVVSLEEELSRLETLLDRDDVTPVQKTEIGNLLKSVLDQLEGLSKAAVKKPPRLNKLYEIPMNGDEQRGQEVCVRVKQGERLKKTCGDCSRPDCICYDCMSKPRLIKTSGDAIDVVFGHDWSSRDRQGYMRAKGLYPVNRNV